ncbi:Two component system response regulator/histidine kinase [Desulfonema limicola]|uniref:Two component system response regulator/histidine kinase n=1 Tax=Desulfonema limicola TaxID=45656 RepID=A0A975B935_9BACT|nr:response regulator [Desulfonema limicola]QTA81009.1 Two component system response regulator/histidine kinase [Desulfonema limicola]
MIKEKCIKFPAKNKLIFINILIITGLMFLVFFINEMVFFRNNMFQELSSIAKITGLNTGFAIALNNREDAQNILCLLNSVPDISIAAIYKNDGSLFTGYLKDNKKNTIPVKMENIIHNKSFCFLYKDHTIIEPVIFQGEKKGFIYIKNNTDKLYQRLNIYLGLYFGMFCLSWITGFLFFRNLDKKLGQYKKSFHAGAVIKTEKKDGDIVTKETGTDLEVKKPNLHKLKGKNLYHILLAEDNLVNQLVARELLEIMGAKVDIAFDGIEALELFKEFFYDLVFMDCQMPNMDGYTATKEIRKYEKKYRPDRRTPVVALTAHFLPDERDKCLGSGMDDFVSKPFKTDELEKIIMTWILEKKAEQIDTSVDINVLNNIRLLQKNGNSTLLEKVVKNYLSNTPALLKKLEAAVHESSAEQIESIAHSLKSSSGTVGAVSLSEMLKTIETMAREKKLEDNEILYLKIIEEYEKVKQFLTKEIIDGA